MFLRQYTKREHGRRVAYWALVESYRTVRGPRQRVVAWLGKLDEAGRLGVREAAHAVGEAESHSALANRTRLQLLFGEDQVKPRWVEVNARGVRVENLRQKLFVLTPDYSSFL